MAEILGDAIIKLKENTGFDIHVSDTKLRKNGLITIEGERFLVDVKTEISRGNKGVILSQLVEASREENLPVLLFIHYIPSDIAKEYIDVGINYADTAAIAISVVVIYLLSFKASELDGIRVLIRHELFRKQA